MTTLNAKANAAYHAMVEQVERDNPGDVWAGFEHEREAYEQGWEDGHEAASKVDRKALDGALADHEKVWHGELGDRCTCGWQPDSWESEDEFEEYYREHRTDAVLALLNGTQP